MEEPKPKKIEIDLISKLPEPILHHILCFLSQRTAATTSVLSKSWRYLWCTRPQIDFNFLERRRTSDSYAILDRTLQAYHDRNLRLDKFAVWLLEDDVAVSLVNKWIPIIIQNMRVQRFVLYLISLRQVELPSLIFESDHIQNLYLLGCTFKSSIWSEVRVYLQRLQTLRLEYVYIPEEILNNILSNCPFLENVSISNCAGFTIIKLFMNNNNNNNKPTTNLTNFSFSDFDHNFGDHVSIEFGNDVHNEPLEFAHRKILHLTRAHLLSSYSFSCNFTKLILCDVYIPGRILDRILSYCPFVETLTLLECKGFETIEMLNKRPTNLAHFLFQGVHGHRVRIEIGNDIKTLRSIDMNRCLFSVSHNKPLEYARLTRLSLRKVKLSSKSFSCNLHSLEELKLDQCSGIKEFKLSSRSMKRLSINNISKHFKATINAPSIVSFVYEGILPKSVSFATTSSDDHLWKSKINLGSFSDEPSHCFNELYGLLRALSQSEISLELDHIEVNVTDDEAKYELPVVVVEHLRIKRLSRKAHYINAAPFLNMLFHMFRPRFMYLGKAMLTEEGSRQIEEILFEERETVPSYIWQSVLQGVSLQEKYRNQSEWQPVEHTIFTQVCKKGAEGVLELRIQLKWSD